MTCYNFLPGAEVAPGLETTHIILFLLLLVLPFSEFSLPATMSVHISSIPVTHDKFYQIYIFLILHYF
jgi:hypothetical protein